MDAPLELAQLVGRFKPELVDEAPAPVSIDGERLGLPTVAVEREHQQPPYSLPERMFPDDPLQLRQNLGRPLKLERSRGPQLDRLQPQLLQRSCFEQRERLVDEVCERRPAPERKPLPVQRRRKLVVRRGGGLGASGEQPLEHVDVQLAGFDHQRVPALHAPEAAARQEPPHLRDVQPKEARRRCRRLLPPERRDQRLGRGGLPTAEQQRPDDRPVPTRRQADIRPLVDDAQRAEHPELHGYADPMRPPSTLRVEHPSDQEDTMKRIALATLAVACCVAAVASLSARAAPAGAPPCTPKKATIGGKPVYYLCGPATATVRAGGKTYTFRNGYCELRATGLVQLFLGTLAAPTKSNAGQPLFNLTANGSGGTVSASYAGKQIVNDLMSFTGPVSQGSFKTITAKITGTWNCHGVVYHGNR